MRKFLALALSCVVLLASLASCAASMGDPNAINDYTPEVKTITTDKGVFTFEETTGDSAILVGYSGRATKDDHVEIPTHFNGRPVVAIGDSVFYNLAAVVEVKIPDTVTKIGKYAFANCTELTAITLPDGVQSIDFAAFTGCTKLETINVGTSLETIGGSAFKSCTALKNIQLPETLVSIGDYAFAYAESLPEFAATPALEYIGTLAFYNCTGLETIKLSDTLKTIGEHAFVTETTSLKAVIDTTTFSEDSVAGKYVAAMAETVTEEVTEAPAEEPEA